MGKNTMTELVQREFDGKWVMWKATSADADSKPSWVCIGIYDYLIDIDGA